MRHLKRFTKFNEAIDLPPPSASHKMEYSVPSKKTQGEEVYRPFGTGPFGFQKTYVKSFSLKNYERVYLDLGVNQENVTIKFQKETRSADYKERDINLIRIETNVTLPGDPDLGEKNLLAHSVNGKTRYSIMEKDMGSGLLLQSPFGKNPNVKGVDGKPLKELVDITIYVPDDSDVVFMDLNGNTLFQSSDLD